MLLHGTKRLLGRVTASQMVKIMRAAQSLIPYLLVHLVGLATFAWYDFGIFGTTHHPTGPAQKAAQAAHFSSLDVMGSRVCRTPQMIEVGWSEDV